jgi:hypothetical protein
MKILRNYNFKLRKSGFTFVEILAALSISMISILTMTKLSLEMVQLSLKNQSADFATQTSSKTAETLIQLRQTSSINGIYTGMCTATINPYTIEVYFDKAGKTNDINLLKYSPLLPNPFPTKRNVPVPQLDGELVDFVKDDLMDPNDIYYKSVKLIYNKTYKTVSGRVVVYYSLYGKDFFYVGNVVYSLASICG